MNSIQWGEVAGFVAVIGFLFGVFYALMRRWFLDLETYKSDKEKKENEENTHFKVMEETVTILGNELRDVLSQIQKEKADYVDLAKVENRIERLDSQIAGVITSVEKQCYRIDLLIDNRNDISELVKELKRDVSGQLKDIRDDIARQENKVVSMQLDVQDLKSRLGG